MSAGRRSGGRMLAAGLAVGGLLFLLLAGGPLAGQESPRAGALDVAEGYRVRLATPSDTLRGVWLAPAAGRLRVRTVEGIRSVPLSRLESLRVRATRARTGAVAGAVAGGVVTGVFMGLLAEALC